MATAPAASDTTLVARLRQRDLTAWEEVYRLYSERLYRFGYQLTGSPHDAADLVQETFVRALPRLDRLNPEGLNLGAYLLTTEKNLFLKQIARAKRQEPVEIVPEPVEPAPLEDDPERSTLLVRQQEEVRIANGALAPRQRLVLALRELEDRSYAEIGELVGLNENAVAQLISRARQRLREELRLVQVDQSKLPAECQVFLPLLSAHLDGQLKGAARDRTLTHLESCFDCQAALEDMREASRRYRSLLPPLIGTELFDRIHDALAASSYWDRPRRRLLRRPRARIVVSAALAGLVVVVGGVVIASRHPSTATAETRSDPGAPNLVLPGKELTAEATGKSGARVEYTVSAHDDVDGPVVAHCSKASGATFPLGETKVECTAGDAVGNEATGTFTVDVTDSTEPTLTLPGAMAVEAAGPAGAPVSYSGSARDRVDGSLKPHCAPASGSTFPIGTTSVTCTARDASGNKASGSFDVTVSDTTPPALRLPRTKRLAATGPTGAKVAYTASADDAVDGATTPRCSRPSGALFPIGTTTVDCTVTDGRGNAARGSFAVTVLDRSAPRLTLPPSKTVEATGPAGARVSYRVSARDRVDGRVTPSCTPASGATFPLGKSIVRCSAVDADGNRTRGSFMIRVVDTTPPALRLPADRQVEAVSASGARVAYRVTARDLVDGLVTARCTPASGATFPLGATTVRCSATDAHGNTASGTFDVTVVDATAPLLTLPGPLTIEATGPSGAPVSYRVSARDRVDGAVTPSCTPASGATFPLGATSVRCTASDGRSNTATGSFQVTVVDTTAPTLSLPADKVVQASSSAGARVAYTASAVDKVDGAVTPSCSPASGSLFPVGKTIVTCTARDARGNAASGSFAVTVTPPALPDLVVTKVSATSFTIANVGNAAAGPFVVTVQGLGSFTVRGLAAGASITRTVQCGSTTRLITVDAQNQVAESNEQNNSAKLPACVIP